MVHRKGYTAARMEDIAAAAGITKGTIYLYFGNKNELLLAMKDADFPTRPQPSAGGFQVFQTLPGTPQRDGFAPPPNADRCVAIPVPGRDKAMAK